MDDLRTALKPLVQHPSSPPPALDAIAARANARRRTRHRVVAAAAVVALAGAAVPAWSLATNDGTSEIDMVDTTPEPREPGTTTTDTAGLPVPPLTTPTTTVTAPGPPADDPFDAAAPWDSAPPLARADAAEFVESWDSNAAARARCPVLAPDDLGEGSGATPRVGVFPYVDKWVVEFDLPGAPGYLTDHDPENPREATADAGRATYSISSIAMPEPPPGMGVTLDTIVDGYPNVHKWGDGSAVGWRVEGQLDLGDPTQPDDTPTEWLAAIKLGGSDCLYQITSFLGVDHVLELIAHLRRVEGAP